MSQSFEQFIRNPQVTDVCKRVGLHIDSALSWEGFADAVVGQNKREDGALVDRMNDFSGVCSSSELMIVCAILTAVDYGRFADEICPDGVWSRLYGAERSVRELLAMAIVRAP